MIVLREKIFRKDYRQKLVEEAAERACLSLKDYIARQRAISVEFRNTRDTEKAIRKYGKIIGDDLIEKYKKNISDHAWNLRNKRILAELPEGAYKEQTREDLGQLGRRRKVVKDNLKRQAESSEALTNLQERIK